MHAAAEPRLELAPHELPPEGRRDQDGEAFFFRALWFGSEREFVGQIIAQRRKHMIFFALTDEPQLGNFVNAVKWVTNGSVPPPSSVPHVFFNPSKALDRFKKLEHLSWGRLYLLDAELNTNSGSEAVWRLFLCPDGYGHWSLLSHPLFRAPFRWHWNVEEALQLSLLPPLELLAQIRSSLLDTKSDAAFARDFARLDRRAQREKCIPLTRGSYEQWEGLLRLFLQIRPISEGDERSSRQMLVEIEPHQNMAGLHVTPKFNIEFRVFFEWTKRYFEPTLDLNLMNQCVAANWRQTQGFYEELEVALPSQHERLEALLQLREWLSDKATPEEIEALLSEG